MKLIHLLLQKKKMTYALVAGMMFFLTMFWSCEDIFETDLSGKMIILIAPTDSLKTDYSTQTFYWEDVKGALSYNLQVVTTSFNQIHQFLADTNLTVPKFTMNLSPGQYEWRVRAQNGSSKTVYFVRSLKIDSTLDLQKTKVLLKTPEENATTNERKISFLWYKIYNANGYTFQIWHPDLNGSKIKDTTVTTNEIITGSNLDDGEYTWIVKAFNNNTNTNFTSREFVIDRTAPKDAPVLTEPRDRADLSQWPVNMIWSRADNDGGSTLYDSVYVAADTFFTVKVRAYKTMTRSQSINLGENTSFFWKVRTFDQAGNKSPESAIHKFNVKTN